MKEETPKCKDCNQPMFEVGGIGKSEQLGEYRIQENTVFRVWYQTGAREVKLYQCPECKEVKLF